ADRKLAALEAARQAGVLSQEEYERKRAAILAAVPALDEPTKKKLAALEAARKAGILSDEEYARKKAALLGGGAQPAPAPQQGQGVPVRTNRKGKVYRHPVGFSFWYPASWSIKEHESFLQLIPADAGQSPEGPTELYFVGAEDVSVDGIREPTDPRVVQVLGEQVRSLSPFVQQVGGAQPVKMSAGKGVMFRWEGKTPRGDQVDARAFVSILRNHAAVLLAVGFKERIQARVEDMGRMFASFGFGEGQRDPALVGRWTLVGVTSITNQSPFETDWSRAQLASKTESTLVFAADGRWERHDKSHMIVGAGGVWLEDNDESTQRGRWNAGEGLLFMVWEDSSWDDFRYQIRRTAKGIELRTLRGSKGEVWHRAE
ncbi:MAG: SHOCT domain-containing protein, partial [Planctomycetota bacterium]